MIFHLYGKEGLFLDLFPLYNSLRIALISSLLVFFPGIFAARWAAKAPRLLKALLDLLFTLPLVLPPTVLGYLLLRLLGPQRPVGLWFLETFGIKLTMQWYSSVFAASAVIFPLFYRSVRAAFEAFDESLAQAGRTLGLSEAYIFWRIQLPCAKSGILAGGVLAFARALGEYGATSMLAGYVPGRTATVASTVYQLWQTNRDAEAFQWVLLNLSISALVLIALNLLEQRSRKERRPSA